MADEKIPQVTIEGANIMFRNFAGREGRFNQEGTRSFAVFIDEDVYAAMERDGWNVKRLKPREDEEDGLGQPYIQVSVKYKGRPPRIVLISSRGRTEVTEDLVDMLDAVEIANCDVILNPYRWLLPNGDTGIKAYLKTMFLTINEDELELKYAGFDDPLDTDSEFD